MPKLTHLDKLYWKKEKIRKGDLIHYYKTVAKYILPYLKNRPVVLHRFPNGINAPHFFQKDVGPNPPPFIQTTPIQHQERKIDYFVIQNVESLLAIANLGAIELHPFHAPIKHLDKPDYLIFDLDPDNVSFDRVIDVALALHHLLNERKIPNFCKTSGGTGLHIYVPLKGAYTYDVARAFAKKIGQAIVKQFPKLTSMERSPAKRKRKIYIDTQQNQQMQTVICPYAVRGFAHATVATPLEWKEVKHGLRPTDFTIFTVPKRLARKGDSFRSLFKKRALIKDGIGSER